MLQVVFQLSYHSMYKRICSIFIFWWFYWSIDLLLLYWLVGTVWSLGRLGCQRMVSPPAAHTTAGAGHMMPTIHAHHPYHGCLFPLFARVPPPTFVSSLSPVLEVPYFTTHPPHLGPWPLEVSRALTFSKWSPCAWMQPVQLWLETNPAWSGGVARYMNLDIAIQLLTSITNRTTVNIHDESQTKILASAHPVTQPRQCLEKSSKLTPHTMNEAEHFWYNGTQHWKMKSFKRTYLFVFVKYFSVTWVIITMFWTIIKGSFK